VFGGCVAANLGDGGDGVGGHSTGGLGRGGDCAAGTLGNHSATSPLVLQPKKPATDKNCGGQQPAPYASTDQTSPDPLLPPAADAWSRDFTVPTYAHHPRKPAAPSVGTPGGTDPRKDSTGHTGEVTAVGSAILSLVVTLLRVTRGPKGSQVPPATTSTLSRTDHPLAVTGNRRCGPEPACSRHTRCLSVLRRSRAPGELGGHSPSVRLISQPAPLWACRDSPFRCPQGPTPTRPDPSERGLLSS